MKLAAILLLTMSAMTVFDTCGDMEVVDKSTTTQTTQPNCCYTDPPIGCSAVCFGANTDMQFVGCNGPGAGENAKNFIFSILVEEDKMHKVGAWPCDSETPIRTVTPCDAAIFPSLNPPNQDLETCMPHALDCSIPTACKWP